MEEMNMSSTALGAEKAIIFISDAHEKFYYEKLKEVRYQDVYHKALVYCLGIGKAGHHICQELRPFRAARRWGRHSGRTRRH